MNKQLLKKACITIWKKDKVGEEIPKQKNKKPIWDKVLKAIIFLKSGSHKEQNPAINEVNKPPSKSNNKKLQLSKKRKYRKIKNTPAVTRVLLCTKEDTGVGAAIARGSQLQKGYCALFVKAANNNNEGKNKDKIFP